ncbi:MAG: hypothetical protein AB1589_35600 [Cyanobacteriota bacterium]
MVKAIAYSSHTAIAQSTQSGIMLEISTQQLSQVETISFPRGCSV